MKRPFLRRRQFLSYLWYRSWYTWHGTQYVQLVHIMHICILYNYIYIVKIPVRDVHVVDNNIQL